MAEDSARAPSSPSGQGFRRPAVLAAALLLLTALAYANAVFNPFLYDDVQLILQNPEIRSLSNIPEIIGFGPDGFNLRGRWTRNVTYALEYAAVGFRPPLYHLNNIVLHALVGLSLFLLVFRVGRDRWVGFWAAAVFLVHPMNTEVVAQVSGRRGLLAALFSLVSILLLQRYCTVGGGWRIAAAAVTLFLGAYSKQHAVMAPFAFMLLDLYARFGEGRGGETERTFSYEAFRQHLLKRKYLYGSLVLYAVTLAVLLVFFTGARKGLGGMPGFYDTSWQGLSAVHRASLMGLGLRLLALPMGQSVDYSFDALGFTTGEWLWPGMLNLVILALAAGLTLHGLVRRNAFGIAGLWYFLFYAPHLGIIPWHEVFAERFLYLPAIGFCIAVAAAGVSLARRLPSVRWVTAVGLMALLGLTAATHLRNEAWSSKFELWSRTVERYPCCARAQKILGNAWMDEGRLDLAVEHYEQAVRILPTFKEAHVNVAGALMEQKEFDRALAKLEEIEKRWPDDPWIWNLRGDIHYALGEAAPALAAYERAVEQDPTFPESYNNLARLYAEQGDVAGAVAMLERTLEHDPAHVPAMKNLAIVYRHAYGDEERAAAYDRQADAITHAR